MIGYSNLDELQNIVLRQIGVLAFVHGRLEIGGEAEEYFLFVYFHEFAVGGETAVSCRQTR